MDELFGIPKTMAPWGLRLDRPVSSEFGEYVVVEITPATIEMHHQVEVVDEAGQGLAGVPVIFGYPDGRGPAIGLRPDENHWRGSPSVLVGNLQRTDRSGYAQHTFNSGGEDIWVWDVGADGVLWLPSAIVKNCRWVGTQNGAPFIHTGVRVVFQRRRQGVPVISLVERLAALEERVTRLEQSKEQVEEK